MAKWVPVPAPIRSTWIKTYSARVPPLVWRRYLRYSASRCVDAGKDRRGNHRHRQRKRYGNALRLYRRAAGCSPQYDVLRDDHAGSRTGHSLKKHPTSPAVPWSHRGDSFDRGAGGGFKETLVETGVATVIGDWIHGVGCPHPGRVARCRGDSVSYRFRDSVDDYHRRTWPLWPPT